MWTIWMISARIEARFDDLVATTAADFVEQQEMLAYVDAFTWAVSLIAIIIGGVGGMNTMLMSVFERTREFGVLRAVGWRPRRVLGMVLGESLILSLLGGAVGTGLGIGGVWLVKNMPFGGMVLPQLIYPGRLLQGMLVALGLGGFGGLYPAWRAAQLGWEDSAASIPPGGRRSCCPRRRCATRAARCSCAARWAGRPCAICSVSLRARCSRW